MRKIGMLILAATMSLQLAFVGDVPRTGRAGNPSQIAFIGDTPRTMFIGDVPRT